jgi:long-chain acyl-CoA synthetase
VNVAAAAPDPAPAVRTIADLPFHVMGRLPKPLLIGRVREGVPSGLSSHEFFEQVRDLSLGLGELGMRPGDRVAVVSESLPEWVAVDLAVLTAGAVTVPVYPTLSAAQVRYILEDSGARLAVVSTTAQVEKLAALREVLPNLTAVVVMDPLTHPPAGVITLDDVVARGHARLTGAWGVGRDYRETARQIRPDRLATIIYTSGTTGEPKGVMLTHGALVSNVQGAATVLDVGLEDTALSFLPLSHAFERMVAFVYLYTGVTMMFAESLDTVGRDIGIVRPSVITGVPRLYEKFQARILEKGGSGPAARAALFRWAVDVGTAAVRAQQRGEVPGPVRRLQLALAERLVFRKIREGLGGRLRLLVSGSAPLGLEQAIFFTAIGLPISEGYGLTETAPAVSVNPAHDRRIGTVGPPLPDVEVRVAPDGEILVRGPNVMTGYYNKPEATAEVLRDGWLHTGDVGTLEDGYLRITDRKKDLIVTSGGKKVAPQPIEAALKRAPLVGEAVLVGDGRRFVAALLVPDFPSLERELAAEGVPPPADRAALVADPAVVARYARIVEALNAELAQFEKIKKFVLLPREFTIDSGELTPTLKVRRRVIEERERERIERLYAEQA